MTRRWRNLGLGLIGLGAFCLGAAGLLDAGFGRDVRFITPKDPQVVALDRALWSPGEPVADIYGIPSETLARVLFVAEDQLVRPVEDPTLVLLPVDKQRGVNPLQTKTVGFVALRAAAGLAALGLIALGVHVWRRRRARPTTG